MNRAEFLLGHRVKGKPEPGEGPDSRIRVLLAIATGLERLGWSIVVENQPDLRLVRACDSCDEVLECLSAQPVDLALIDEELLEPQHCEALRASAAGGQCRFVLAARHAIDETRRQTQYSFASGCLLKGFSAGELLAAIRADR